MNFEQFEILRNLAGLTNYNISKYYGISESTFTNTKKRGKKISNELENRIMNALEHYSVLIEKKDIFENAWWTGDISITVRNGETKIWDKTSVAFKSKLPSTLIRFETPPQYQDVLPFVLALKRIF